jgi:PPK2 family polyphosphate:nucleotide phosphotransferase
MRGDTPRLCFEAIQGTRMIDSPYLVKPGKKINLSKIETADTGHFKDKEEALAVVSKDLAHLKKLQDLLYADGRRAVLIVLQAMDTGGKDGVIEHVFSGVNPQGCFVTSFKQPTPLEHRHDFLWRIHNAAPPKGVIGIFNRSHYESVLVERVHDLVPKKIWSKRYNRINDFEKLLADEGTTILKFFLHISKETQKERLQKRLDDKKRQWKFSAADLAERKLWDDYTEAYEDALSNCSTEDAPWYIVPADHKWFRNWVISNTIVRTMQKLKLQYPPPSEDVGKVRVT